MARGALVVIGNLDGVHRGHQALVADAALEARRLGLAPSVLTFHPHPAAALGRSPPAVLTTLPRRLELLARVEPGLAVVVERFDQAFASQSPEEFARRVLVGRLSASVVVVGKTFRFGKNRAGDFDELVRLGKELGFEARSHEIVGDARGTFSSTRIRRAIADGDLDDATSTLGRFHSLSGTVVVGDRRGRTIGFPTVNLGGIVEALPPFGVYAVLVDRLLAPEPAPDEARPARGAALALGVANIGLRPTVHAAAFGPSVEAHLFDLDHDLYGAMLRVHLVARIRPEQKFGGLDELRRQIADDAQAARKLLSPLAPDPCAGGAYR